jgi:hypothetical protein
MRPRASAKRTDELQAAVLDAGANRERMIGEAHAMTVARRRDLIDAAASAPPRWCRSRRAGMIP